MTQQVKAFIFDLDGVLTDTAEYHYLAWQRLADEEGLPFDRETGETLRGVDRRESLMTILAGRQFPEDKVQELMERKNAYYVDSLGDIDARAILPGVLDLIHAARAAGIATAVGSASKNAAPVLEKLGIADLFDAVADGHTVQVHKPAPDLFLTVAAQINVDPANAVVFEDAQAGVEAALAGGFRAVGLGPVDRVGQATVVYPDLSNVTLEGILTDLAG